MGDVTRNGAVIVILGDNDVGGFVPAEDLVVHAGRVLGVARSRTVRVIGGIRLLRPENRQVRLLVGQDVIHENVGQVREARAGQRATAVERIGGLSILEPPNGQ